MIIYLDYCTEMLSLCRKIAALYGETSHDAVVIETVGDLGQITSNLSNKIWQKTRIVESKVQPSVMNAFAATPVVTSNPAH